MERFRMAATTTMSYEAIRAELNKLEAQATTPVSERERLLLDAIRQLTVVLESDLTQIKGALGHVARLLEDRRTR
jgi:hypothetical protein